MGSSISEYYYLPRWFFRVSSGYDEEQRRGVFFKKYPVTPLVSVDLCVRVCVRVYARTRIALWQTVRGNGMYLIRNILLSLLYPILFPLGYLLLYK